MPLGVDSMRARQLAFAPLRAATEIAPAGDQEIARPMNQKTWLLTGVALFLGALSAGCQSGGVGDPCTPEDEYQQFFSGYAFTEVNIESKSFQCETRLCLVNHFQGRVSCPYGQTATQAMMAPGPSEYQLCHIPGTSDQGNRIQVAVEHQLTSRRPTDSVYCSCRCDGPDPNARYCKCPTGFQCTQLLQPNSRLGAAELSGSYCTISSVCPSGSFTLKLELRIRPLGTFGGTLTPFDAR